MCEHLAVLTLNIQIQQQIFIYAIVIVHVMRRDLVSPNGLPARGTSGEDGASPFVIAGTHVGIPRPRIAGAIVDEVELRIVGDPAPTVAAADLPGCARPGFDTQVGAAVG